MSIGVRFAHFFDPEKQLDQVDDSVGLVGISPGGEDVVETEFVAWLRVNTIAVYSTESLSDVLFDLIYRDRVCQH